MLFRYSKFSNTELLAELQSIKKTLEITIEREGVLALMENEVIAELVKRGVEIE